MEESGTDVAKGLDHFRPVHLALAEAMISSTISDTSIAIRVAEDFLKYPSLLDRMTFISKIHPKPPATSSAAHLSVKCESAW